MSPFRLIALLLILAGVLIVIAGFYDFLTAEEEDGTPVGWYLLPVGGLVALVGLGMIGREAHHGTAPFTEEELDQARRDRRDPGDD